MNTHDRDAPAAGPRPSLRWKSQDYSVLRKKVQDGFVYDVVIVGSGYGGSMAAAELAGRCSEPGKALRVCVLERGNEYAPGMFPSSMQELPPHVRVHRQGRDTIMGQPQALLDVRVGPDVSALLGNGLGGGSLINAGVMEKPRWHPSQEQRVPRALRAALTDAFLAEVKLALHAKADLHEKVDRLHGERLQKTQALQKVARHSKVLTYRDAAITVQTATDDPDVPQCTLCGDCMTGCNVGAKRSLDTTLLAQAKTRGAEIYTGATVLKVRRDPQGGWVLHTVFTDASLRERHQPQEVRARKVILAAGTLGSTEILLHSRDTLSLSRRLGSGFSCNGDNLVAVQGTRHPTNTTTDEWNALDQREVGPTITGVVDIPGGPLLEEFSVPAPLKRLFDETVTTARLLHRLPKWPTRSSAQKRQGLDSMAVDPEAMKRTLLVGVVGHDEAQGQIVAASDPELEGGAGVAWTGIRNSRLLEHEFDLACQALNRATPPGADILPNPVWQPVPPEMSMLVEERGPVLTVHPLGGCPMGENDMEGVVNEFGQVFEVTDQGCRLYRDLVVLDGSILPCSVGANPALTISAIALRAARELARQWGWSGVPACTPAPAPAPVSEPDQVYEHLTRGPEATTPVLQLRAPPPSPPGPSRTTTATRTRPTYRPIAKCTPRRPSATRVELMERLCGAAGQDGEFWVELTLCYRDLELQNLTGHAARELQLDAANSWIRVYDNSQHDASRRLLTLNEPDRLAQARFAAKVGGSLVIDEPWGTVARPFRAAVAAYAWFLNRGKRELWDWLTGDQEQRLDLKSFFGSAGRAGERRVFHYALHVDEVLHGAQEPRLGPALRKGRSLRGTKCLTYGLRSNPWLQLTRLQMDGFPLGKPDPVLTLDGRFMVSQGVPLLRVVSQENQVTALMEFASFALCWVRMLVSIHLWSFRAPDRAPRRPRNLLPGPVAGLPAPAVVTLPLEDPGSPVPAFVRLTRYENPGCPPVALIHGYSTSGTTFTHSAIRQPLARHLWEAGRDVWVLDLRTSAGMPSALEPWHFEDAAFADIPVALQYIANRTGQRVSVFAHCIGAVMVSMALLADPRHLYRFNNSPDDRQTPKRWQAELVHLKENIERIVFCQKGPMLVYCDDNVLRAYFMRVLRRVVFPDDYQFEVPESPTLAGSLMDRLLATLPYPPEEFVLENPRTPWKRTPWAGFRHRMDALYARDFSLANIEEGTLDAITDLFGPINLDTVAQAIHFARRNTITDQFGRPFNTSAAALQQRWPKRGTVSIHGSENGLVNVKTVDAMRSQMQFAGIPYLPIEIAGYGHQDCLIGRNAARDVFPHISANL